MKDFPPVPAPQAEQIKHRPLTCEEVGLIVDSFLKHIAENWDTYSTNLPALRRTLMHYNEFAYGLCRLPENTGRAIQFNPREPLMPDILQIFFGDSLTPEIADLVYDAWPLRIELAEWEGYEEPKVHTPESLHADFPGIFPTLEDARYHMYNEEDTDFAWYEEKRLELCTCGNPQILFAGFSSAEEFPAQTAFLDTIRNHPRIRLGIELMEDEYERKRRAQSTLSDSDCIADVIAATGMSNLGDALTCLSPDERRAFVRRFTDEAFNSK